MTNAEQASKMFKEWLKAREVAPWVAIWMDAYGADVDRLTCKPGLHHASMRPFACLQRMGGMAGIW